MALSFEPITNEPSLYINNLQVTRTGNKTLAVASGQCRDSTNTIDINLTAPLALDATLNGANGLDTGSLAASTWYAVFIIADFRGFEPTACLISLSDTAPIMPENFGALRKIGHVLTDGSSNILGFDTSGNQSTRFIQWLTPISVLSGGTQNGSFAPVNLSVGAPKSAAPVYLNITYDPTGTTSTGSIRPTGSATAFGSCPIELKGNVAAVTYKDNMVKFLPRLATGNASLDYELTSGDSLSLSVAAFEDIL